MSHTPYPNNYAPPQSQFSPFRQSQHVNVGAYTPSTSAKPYPDAYVDHYQQSRPPWDPTGNPQQSSHPNSPFHRPPSVQPPPMNLASPAHVPSRTQSPLHSPTGPYYAEGGASQFGYSSARSPGLERTSSVFSQYSQGQGGSQYIPAPQQSPPRRPLPTPQARPVTNPIPDRRPLPATQQVSPSAPSSPFHRTSYSTSAAPTSSGFSTQSTDSTSSSGSQISARSSRPLPTPIPRSTRSVDLTRSSSPVKDILNQTGPLPPPGQKFVPLWKRSLPAVPGLPPTSDHPPSPFEKRSSISGTPSGDHNGGSGLQRNASAMRPLPPSPAQSFPSPAQYSPIRPTPSRGNSVDGSTVSSPSKTTGLRTLPSPPNGSPHKQMVFENRSPELSGPDASVSPFRSALSESPRHSPLSSESEDMYENSLLHRPPNYTQGRPPSPSFGVRETPGRIASERVQKPNEHSHPTGPFRARRQSIVSRMAELSLNGSSFDLALSKPSNAGESPPRREHPMPAIGRASTQPVPSRWPSELPPLPRTPQVPSDPGQSSPTRVPPPQHPSQASPTRPHFPSASRDTSPVRQPPPQHPANTSPTRSRFSQAPPQSCDTSPTRNTAPQPPLSERAPQSNPTSPTRIRFPPQAPVREPILPAPLPQRMIPNLEDAPPPSLRRSPSPIRQPTFTHARQNSSGLPVIRTQGASNTGVSANMPSQPSAVTPSSATSAFSLSSFPVPPQTQGYGIDAHSALNPRTRGGQESPQRRALPSTTSTQSNHWEAGPSFAVSGPDQGYANDIPRVSVGGMDDDSMPIPSISIGDAEASQPSIPQISVSGSEPNTNGMPRRMNHPMHPLPAVRNPGGLFCGACGGAILGRSINTMGANWHPGCFRCAACDQLLENLAMYEHEGRLYCSLDYYEKFAPRCYHCQTAIADQDYITLSESDGLGKRTYHTQHFFCAECGDPFLPASTTARNFSGDGTFDGGAGEGFTVYNGHPYCERCHVRLRMPKCKKCKKPIRKDMDALEVLGGKWCPECFVCKACEGPFTNGRFFLRDEKPFCQRCFEIIIKSEL